MSEERGGTGPYVHDHFSFRTTLHWPDALLLPLVPLLSTEALSPRRTESSFEGPANYANPRTDYHLLWSLVDENRSCCLELFRLPRSRFGRCLPVFHSTRYVHFSPSDLRPGRFQHAEDPADPGSKTRFSPPPPPPSSVHSTHLYRAFGSSLPSLVDSH